VQARALDHIALEGAGQGSAFSVDPPPSSARRLGTMKRVECSTARPAPTRARTARRGHAPPVAGGRSPSYKRCSSASRTCARAPAPLAGGTRPRPCAHGLAAINGDGRRRRRAGLGSARRGARQAGSSTGRSGRPRDASCSTDRARAWRGRRPATRPRRPPPRDGPVPRSARIVRNCRYRRLVGKGAGSTRATRNLATPLPRRVRVYTPKTTKPPRVRGFGRADDGTRTHDLLHGKCERPSAPVRSRSLKRPVCRAFRIGSERERTRANAEPCHSCHGVTPRRKRLGNDPIDASFARATGPGAPCYDGRPGPLKDEISAGRRGSRS
jgi:hypothetical protein